MREIRTLNSQQTLVLNSIRSSITVITGIDPVTATGRTRPVVFVKKVFVNMVDAETRGMDAKEHGFINSIELAYYLGKDHATILHYRRTLMSDVNHYDDLKDLYTKCKQRVDINFRVRMRYARLTIQNHNAQIAAIKKDIKNLASY